MQFDSLHPLFGALVDGIDLSEPLTCASVAEIHAAVDRHAILLFREQHLTERQQMQVGEALGPVEAQPASVGVAGARLQDRRMNDISNLSPDGSLMARDAPRRLFNLGNRLWHTDSSFKVVPAKYSLLYAHHVPAQGGDTEFADMRAAWDALAPDLQADVRHFIARHSLLYSRALLGFVEFSPDELKRYEPVPQRLVRRIPGSGRLALYLASHIGAIDGMPRPEAMVLVRELIEHATQPAFVYRHRWQQGDLVLWDNRCTMHRATRFDDRGQIRDMRRVTVGDENSSLAQPA